MQIESFPNELFINLFQYLSTADLFRAFHGLNDRFHHLLSDSCRRYGWDFQGISRSDFDTICQTYLPQTMDQIRLICFNNDERTPGQVDHFYTHRLRLDQFTHLQSLSVRHLRCEALAHQLILELQNLPCLIHLTYKPFCYPSNKFSARHFISGIWRLKKLQRCHLAFQFNLFMYFPLPFIQSTTLECLTLEAIELVPDEIAQLINQTPNLRNISFHLNFQFPINFWLTTVPQITKLYIHCSWDSSVVIDVIKWIPSLWELKLNLRKYCIDGHKWKEIIYQHLPKLKILQFLMLYKFSNDTNKEQEIDRLLDTFRGHFWLSEYHCFVQCDWNDNERNAHIYTLPYNFEGFSLSFPRLSKTTCLNEDKQWSYHAVRSLAYCPEMSQCFTLSNIQFFKIRNLSVKLPLGDHFWSTITKFDQVNFLVISLNDDIENSQIQLDILLSQMPHLSILTIHERPSLVLQLLTFQSMQMCRCLLNLLSSNHWYDKEQCIALASLPFVTQCRALAIAVGNRSCVVDLFTKMINLQALSVLCRDDQWKPDTDPSVDELVNWLREHLASSCTIRRNSPYQIIGIWIS